MEVGVNTQESIPFKHHAPGIDVLLVSAGAWHTC